jgi:hypothetical protein
MLFFYTARNTNNQLVRGTIEAISAQAARQALKEMDLIAEELHEATLQEKKAVSEGTVDLAEVHRTPNLVLEGTKEIIEEEEIVETPSKEEPVPATPEKSKPKKKKSSRAKKKAYYPFAETLGLYAGWLLAWYCIVYALGSYQHTREVSFHIPYIEALLPPFSPVVLTFTLVAFLFLMLSSVHRVIGGGKLKAFILLVVGVAAFSLYRLNV